LCAREIGVGHRWRNVMVRQEVHRRNVAQIETGGYWQKNSAVRARCFGAMASNKTSD
jgi:hypothetical protein